MAVCFSGHSAYTRQGGQHKRHYCRRGRSLYLLGSYALFRYRTRTVLFVLNFRKGSPFEILKFDSVMLWKNFFDVVGVRSPICRLRICHFLCWNVNEFIIQSGRLKCVYCLLFVVVIIVVVFWKSQKLNPTLFCWKKYSILNVLFCFVLRLKDRRWVLPARKAETSPVVKLNLLDKDKEVQALNHQILQGIIFQSNYKHIHIKYAIKIHLFKLVVLIFFQRLSCW